MRCVSSSARRRSRSRASGAAKSVSRRSEGGNGENIGRLLNQSSTAKKREIQSNAHLRNACNVCGQSTELRREALAVRPPAVGVGLIVGEFGKIAVERTLEPVDDQRSVRKQKRTHLYRNIGDTRIHREELCARYRVVGRNTHDVLPAGWKRRGRGVDRCVQVGRTFQHRILGKTG